MGRIDVYFIFDIVFIPSNRSKVDTWSI